jgi:KamA family protein
MSDSDVTIIKDEDLVNFKSYQRASFKRASTYAKLSSEKRLEIDVVSRVLPFRVNNFVLQELINWDNAEEDPIFRLLFPHKKMLLEEQYDRLLKLVKSDASDSEINQLISAIRTELNPHPADQLSNIPKEDDDVVNGLQHKYRETVLLFPSEGQYCHSYCSFCFRWPQFTSNSSKIAVKNTNVALNYLKQNKEVTDVLVTGGDPMVMKTKKLANYLLPLIGPDYQHIKNIRIGTKSLTFWPQRYIFDDDADELFQLFKQLQDAGKQIAIMAHINHPQEMIHPIFHQAVDRIRGAKIAIRSQAPLLRGINDCHQTWSKLWEEQVRLGIYPYYFFLHRDTGAKNHFEVSLAKALEIYRGAYQSVSGLARTARGPVMSTSNGKVQITGRSQIMGQDLFVLEYIQARDATRVKQPFYAKFCPDALWFDELIPLPGFERMWQA